MERKGTVWKSFLVSSCLIFIVSVIVSIIYYNQSVKTMTDEILRNNSENTAQLQDNLVRKIEQIDRLAVGISVSSDTMMFFNSENPEEIRSSFYAYMQNMLVAYTYSNNDCVSNVMLYSPQYNRLQTRKLASPYYSTGNLQQDRSKNAEWIHSITEPEAERTKRTFQIRSVNWSFPYVMTLIRQIRNDSGWGVVAVDIDLSKLYDAIWIDSDASVSAWVLDGKGRVIVRQDKDSLYESALNFSTLSTFEKNQKNSSLILTNQEVPIAYSQNYLEEFDLYVVTVTELGNFRVELLLEQISSVFLCAVCTGAACLVIWLYTCFTSKPLNRILEMLRNPVQAKAEMEYSEAEVQEAAELIVSYLQINTTLEAELEKRLAVLRKTQLQALKAQINPHFLFNTLNAIALLIENETENSEAVQVTMELADILHYSLSDDDLVVLEEELNNTKRYIAILSRRYQNQFDVELQVEPDILDALVPRMILQPLIENAVFHGIAAWDGVYDGHLKIMIGKQTESRQPLVRIDISDNGAGMPPEKVRELLESMSGEHISMNDIGVQNVARKLKLLYPKMSHFEIVSEPGQGTTISMIFPYSRDSKKRGRL